MTAYIEHPRLCAEAVEARAYQIEAVSDCLGAPTLLVLPTALGKTPIEWMVIAERLNTIGGRALMIAPTNALVNQHLRDLKLVIDKQESEDSITSISGSIDWKKRQKRWDAAEIIIATPQVIRNDVQRGSIDLKDVSVLVVDEAHHSKGRHAVAEVGDQYLQSAQNPLVLGATASPGSSQEQVEEVCKRLGLKRIHSRTAENPFLAPYAAGLQVKEVPVNVDEGLKLMAAPLILWMNGLVDQLRRLGYHVQTGRVTSSQLNDTRERIQRAIAKGEGLAYNAARQCAQSQRLLNLIGYLLSQGVSASREYLSRVKTSGEGGDKGSSAFFKDDRITSLYEMLQHSEELHEKVGKTVELVQEQIEINPESRVIVFAHFRDTVDEIVQRLDDCQRIKPERFVGQATREGSSGMTQKEQLSGLQRFRDGECNVLVATSVGEEGLDIPKADRVIFYEPIGSEIRTIQRRGRTGRHSDGNVYVLIARETRDEGARASAVYREQRMQKVIDSVRRNMGRPNKDDLAEHLTTFKVRDGAIVGSAYSFMQSEMKSLTPELGERKSRISTTVEDADTEDAPQVPPPPLGSDPKRLRPKGQTGLDSFPSIAPPPKEDEPTDENTRDSLEKLAIRAAEDIVQALTTEAVDPLTHDSSNPCRIVVDHREPNTTIAATLRLQGVDVDVQTLQVGDFKIGDRVLIERKRVRDFIDSLLDGRLLNQAHRLIAAAPRPLLLIEGGGLFSQRAVHNNSLMGALATLTIDLGLPVVTTQDGEETARFLIIAARREQALLGALTKEARGRMKLGEEGNAGPWFASQQPGSGEVSEGAVAHAAESVIDSGLEGGQRVILDASKAPLSEKEERNRLQDRISVLEALPGIGPTTAKRIIDHFGSIEKLTKAEIGELCEISGIGPATAEKIKRILRG
ncbi:MAG TPA: DEAD/DEAH box helicase [Candidatus Thalassarchaeaceae archaeon]|nr:MAG TPA: DEAD/DEAH box helicase [Candidatus Poseidoniales archaeon]HIH82529.1 DEAD/DEAH box helicase [Candidatus Thalassarchaeaceae archaeon]